jgi:hypothetical protein
MPFKVHTLRKTSNIVRIQVVSGKLWQPPLITKPLIAKELIGQFLLICGPSQHRNNAGFHEDLLLTQEIPGKNLPTGTVVF